MTPSLTGLLSKICGLLSETVEARKQQDDIVRMPKEKKKALSTKNSVQSKTILGKEEILRQPQINKNCVAG